ncbi:MAG TPA: WcbI family polysaccharide biosynthesis putative acetyltransferase [Rhodopila sp.]|uniref:WcbI family polysaccharide biosynthesis putative acetyltransferase n=1 Tax=Rhodopila sp. TaxID=2480087 RepID=UPI002C88F537|nr:WcbI family polysaccharide biosynthesis putative acetyltransferase [Rhodopila sp.]HVY15875.1 WcbI family polysaccharide biosynthesis putative acetyltransferase [Rhodopila sp.]
MADPTGIEQGNDDRALLGNFESLGGAGRGSEFEEFLRRRGARSVGVLGGADLATDFLISALEQRLEGVGEPAYTTIFRPPDNKDWWTRDTRYWMATSTMIRATTDTPDELAPAILEQRRAQRAALIAALTEGRKLFVFRDLAQNLNDVRLNRLHAAVRAFGPGTLFYLRYEDEGHPSGLVEAAKPGLLIGYVSHFSATRDRKTIGLIDDVLMQLCRRAWALHRRQTEINAPAPAPAAEAPPPASPDISTETAPDIASDTALDASPDAPTDVPDAPPATSSTPAPAAPRGPRSGRRLIVFVGDRQAEAMAALYRRFIAPGTRDRLDWVANDEARTERGRTALLEADLIVEQVADQARDAGLDDIASGTPRIQLPHVTGAFLWPFRALVHPKAVALPFCPGGAYDSETCDSYLNSQIAAGVDPDQAVEDYLDLDVNTIVDLNQMYELTIDRQRARDAATGYGIADVIETHFRDEYLFLTPNYLNVRLSLALAEELFGRIGAKPEDIERMRARTRVSPFPVAETPIHPAVARHWGLDYIAPNQRYRFRLEGGFTFREFARRYMRYEWSPALEEGRWLSGQGRDEEAVIRLRQGLAVSPRSVSGYQMLGETLGRLGDNAGAVAELRTAAAIAPTNAEVLSSLGQALQQAGNLAEAEKVLDQTVTADPTEPRYRIQLAHLLQQAGHSEEAAAVFEQALDLEPLATETWQVLAGVREALGDGPGAEAALRKAIELDDGDSSLRQRLEALLRRHGRQEEPAGEPGRTAAAEEPPHPFEPRDSEPAAAASSDSEPPLPEPPDSEPIAAAFPDSEPPLPEPPDSEPDAAEPADDAPAMVEAAKVRTPLMDALTAAIAAPSDGKTYHELGVLLRESGDIPAAEAAFRKAIALAPDEAHYRHELSIVCLRAGRLPEAIAAAEEAIEREPRNPHRHAYLADILVAGNEFERARQALRAALSRTPGHVPFHIKVSDTFAREGRLEEALDAAWNTVSSAPDHADALGQLAHIEQLSGQWQMAEAHLRAALALAPDSAPLRQQLERLMETSQGGDA